MYTEHAHYSPNVVLEIIGLLLEKANTGNYEDKEYIVRRIQDMRVEISNRKIPSVKLVVDNVNNNKKDMWK